MASQGIAANDVHRIFAKQIEMVPLILGQIHGTWHMTFSVIFKFANIDNRNAVTFLDPPVHFDRASGEGVLSRKEFFRLDRVKRSGVSHRSHNRFLSYGRVVL